MHLLRPQWQCTKSLEFSNKLGNLTEFSNLNFFFFILGQWLAFLQQHSDSVRGISRDTWNMFLNFSDSVGNDLSVYDEDEAWPSLFDDFVEYENDQANQNYETTVRKPDFKEGSSTPLS